MLQDLQLFLADIWFFLLGLVLVLYVILDGFDLGVGILSLFAENERCRGIMMKSLGYVWDANETWLVILGGALFGAFPLAYGLILHALYLPLFVMIFGLIFRGLAFGFRENAERKLPWNPAFGLGSLMAALAQGFILGGFIGGIPVAGQRLVGDLWAWLTPFSALVAIGARFGYALLGATYLIVKTEGGMQQRQYRNARIAACLMLAAAAGISIWTPLRHAYVAERWFAWPNIYIALLPSAAFLSFLMLMRGLARRQERAPFFWTLAIFLFSFIGLAISLYPYIVPTTVTLGEAAASPKTLVFMLTGIGMLIPLMLGYNAYQQYAAFRGKVREEEGYPGS